MEATDANDLRLLTIAHYVLAGLTAAAAAFFVPWAVIGWQTLDDARQALPDPVPGAFEPADQAMWGAVILCAGASIAALCLVHGGVLFYVGRCLACRRRRTLCLVFSALHVLNFPIGAILSAFTFLVLRRPSVRQAFSAAPHA